MHHHGEGETVENNVYENL